MESYCLWFAAAVYGSYTAHSLYHPIIGAMALWANGISTAADDADYQPKLNGAGEPVIPMTPEQKFEFDLQVLLCPAESCKPSHSHGASYPHAYTPTPCSGGISD
jgi:hypothetical protein